jgi:general stress protein YciG
MSNTEIKMPKAARQYLSEIGAKGGSVKSKAKAKAVAKNGKKGGRPKKVKKK